MLTVAYLGPEHTNTHLAAMKRFGERVTFLDAPTVDEVFHLVERREADYGVVPIENSLEGAVTHTLDRFIEFVDTPIRIQGEIELPVRHFLITYKNAHLSRIQMVFSHPQALAQCRHWLEKHLRQAVYMQSASTASAVTNMLHKVKSNAKGLKLKPVRDTARAAIGRKELATKHRLHAIPIPVKGDNMTRFLIIGLKEPKRSARSKTSILFALKDRPGALHDSLIPFKREGINLTKIESRPSKRKAWEYLFFVDVEAYETEPKMKRALRALGRSTSLLRVLGSYPVAK